MSTKTCLVCPSDFFHGDSISLYFFYFKYREELEKQKSKERYMKLHLEGKTEQARADLARLAIIKKQREEAAKKREELRKGKTIVQWGESIHYAAHLNRYSIHTQVSHDAWCVHSVLLDNTNGF